MEDISIGVSVPISECEVDSGKVTKLVKKFVKHAEKTEANPFEIGAAISVLQDNYFDVYGALPISKDTIATVKKSRMYEIKED